MRRFMAMALLSLFAANGLRLAQIGDFVTGQLAQFPPRVDAERRLVLHNGRGYYGFDLIQNDPWLRGSEVVLLVPTGWEGKVMEQHFPGATLSSRNGFGTTYIDNPGER